MAFWLFDMNRFSVILKTTVLKILTYGCFKFIDFPDTPEQIILLILLRTNTCPIGVI